MDIAAFEKLKGALKARLQGRGARIQFPGADFSGAPLPGAELGGAHLAGATFSAASLVGANLVGANLEGAVLHGADLGGADLTDAKMIGVDLSKTQLDDALLVNSDLRGAYLRDTRGEPLSMAGALIDQKAISRSGLTDEDLNSLLGRGVTVEKADSLPPNSRELISIAPPSYVSILQLEECESRSRSVSQAPDAPRSSRKMANFLTQLIEDARIDQGIPLSLRRNSLPAVSLDELMESMSPEVGVSFMGVKIDEELSDASVARTFVGVNQDGQRCIVKAFDPLRHGAALHLPAFQRGLRAMNRALCAEDESLKMMGLLAVAPDFTAYVARYYGDGTLEQMVNVNVTLDTGLQLFEQLCKSFEAIHAMGALVRSIKPSNILLEGLTPLLTEIDMIDLPTMMECSANAGGYAAYAAPEELTRRGTRSPSADVFALGKLLEYLLTGQDPVDPLTGTSILKARTEIPPFLVQLVERCTEPDPARRFQHVSDVLVELERFRAEGHAAQLKAPMRVESLSRIQAMPSLLPAESKAVYNRREEVEDNEPPPVHVSEEKWLSRRVERSLGGLALLGGLGVAGAVWFSPKNVDFVEGSWLVVSVTLGMAAWLLPEPGRRLAAFRLASWAAVASVLYFAGPLPLARARWKHDLNTGSLEQKERAVISLIRSGARKLSNKNLEKLRLMSQDLSEVDFRGTSLRGANLSKSLIRESNFQGANLSAALVYGADLQLSSLDGAQGISDMLCDSWTRFPEGVECLDGHARRVVARAP